MVYISNVAHQQGNLTDTSSVRPKCLKDTLKPQKLLDQDRSAPVSGEPTLLSQCVLL